MHQMKLNAQERFVELTLAVPEGEAADRLLRDIAAFNAQVEAASQASAPSWLSRLT